jgi:hypothetical protein
MDLFRTRRAARNGALAIRLGGSGDVTSTHLRWRYENSLPDVPAPLVLNDVVFLIRSGGIATTLDAPSGRVLKQGRLTGALEDYYSSPVAAAGKVVHRQRTRQSRRPVRRRRLGDSCR